MQKSLSEIANLFDTDKTQSLGYIKNFERHFGHLRDKPIKILEIGVLRGGSLLMWQEYFPKGLVVGLDIKANPFAEMPERIRYYQGSQDDENLLDKIGQECAPDGFDIIIDDAAHNGKLARASYRNLFQKHLKTGGIYLVEDWGTGYWGFWPDGKNYETSEEKYKDDSEPSLLKWLFKKLGGRYPSVNDADFATHNFGMVGFVKELVDEVAWPDITAPDRGNKDLQSRPSSISEMTIYNGHLFIIKA